MLVLPILLPLFLDQAIDAALETVRTSASRWRLRSFTPRQGADRHGVWVRVRPILSSAGALDRLDIGPAPSTEPDDDREIDLRLLLAGDPQETAAALKDDLVLHLMSCGLRRRMRQEGRELAHLPIDDLKALLVQVCDGADSPERWTWRFDEWTTFEAALLESECRAEESEEDRLEAAHGARALRERRAAETEEARVWWDRLPAEDRVFLQARLPDVLSDDDRKVVAKRRHARMVEWNFQNSSQDPEFRILSLPSMLT